MRELTQNTRHVVNKLFLENDEMTIEQRNTVLDVLEEGSGSIVNNLLEMQTRLGAVKYYEIESALALIFFTHREVV